MELLFESRTNLGGFRGLIRFVQRRPTIRPEPVLRPDCFADAKGMTIYGSVLRDNGKLRMWYHAFPQDWDFEHDMSSIAYAESEDGIHWTKPALDVLKHGPNANNLTNLGLHSATVFMDPDSPPSHRYRAAGCGYKGLFLCDPRIVHRGYYTSHSADGLHWDLDAPAPRWLSSDVITTVYHPDRRCGIVAMKYTPRVSRINRRSIHTAEFRDGAYSDAVSALYPDEFDDLLAATRGYHTGDYYGMGMLPAGQGLVGFLWNYWHQLPYTAAPQGLYGGSDVTLVYQPERGGRFFHLPGRPLFLDRQLTPWPDGWINTASNVVEVGDEHRLYFSGTAYSHGFGLGTDWKRLPQWSEYRGKHPLSGITYASWPKWRLFGFDADPEGSMRIDLGRIDKPSEVLINYEITKPEGSIRCELKGDGLVLRSAEESIPLTEDSIAAVVRWKDEKDGKEGSTILPAASASLTLNMRCARVYAYEVRPLE